MNNISYIKCFLNLFVLFFALGRFIWAKNVFHSSAYEDIYKGKRLNKTPIDTLDLNSASKCGFACNKNSQCRSFVFCGERSCELNTEDVHSTTEGDLILQNDNNCVYFGMKQVSTPLCHEDGQYVNIQSDIHEGECDIHEKRVDMQWKSIERAVIDNATEFKIITETTIYVSTTHGGLSDRNVVEGNFTRWLKFIKNKLNWTAAKKNCLLLKGKLFYDMDGTDSQLAFLSQKMGGETHWLGIYTEDHKIWKSIEGTTISNDTLKWIPGQPNNHKNRQFYVTNVKNGGLNDVRHNHLFESVCDMVI